MPSILDAFPFPFASPEAQRLHIVLSQLHPTAQGAVLLAERAGLDRGQIDPGQPPYFVWSDVLALAGREGLTRRLVQHVHHLLSATNPQRPFLAGLLAAEHAPTEAEPRAADGAPRFLSDTDAVSEHESLLFHDDLTIPLGRVQALIETLQRLLPLASAVCRLVIDARGASQLGTGFRIGPDLLLTNWHVLHNSLTEERATTVRAEFGYEHDDQGRALTPSEVPCDPSSVVSNKDDDWAVIRVAAALNDAWPVVPLSGAADPEIGSAAYIIQHPGGDRKRLGFVRNLVTAFDSRVVHYLTDTQEGSSGAPVFDARGRLIALHHAGGRPQQVVGKPPVKKNEGIRISCVRAGLTSGGVAVP